MDFTNGASVAISYDDTVSVAAGNAVAIATSSASVILSDATLLDNGWTRHQPPVGASAIDVVVSAYNNTPTAPSPCAWSA